MAAAGTSKISLDPKGVSLEGIQVESKAQVLNELQGHDHPGQRPRDASDAGRDHDDAVSRRAATRTERTRDDDEPANGLPG